MTLQAFQHWPDFPERREKKQQHWAEGTKTHLQLAEGDSHSSVFSGKQEDSSNVD